MDLKLNPLTVGLYSIRDALAEEFSPPFVAKNSAVAIRHFTTLIQKERVIAADYALYCVALWDPHKGIISPNTSPVLVREASESNIPAGVVPFPANKEEQNA